MNKWTVTFLDARPNIEIEAESLEVNGAVVTFYVDYVIKAAFSSWESILQIAE